MKPEDDWKMKEEMRQGGELKEKKNLDELVKIWLV